MKIRRRWERAGVGIGLQVEQGAQATEAGLLIIWFWDFLFVLVLECQEVEAIT